MSYFPISSVDLEKNKYADFQGNSLASQLQNTAILIDNNNMDFMVLHKNAHDVSNQYDNLHNVDSVYIEPREHTHINDEENKNNNDIIIKLYIGTITVVGLFMFFRILKKTA